MTTGTDRPRPFELADIAGITVPSSPSISPDGRAVAYALRVQDPDRDVSSSSIWTVATDGSGTPRRITDGPDDSEPVWSPAGASIAFVRLVQDRPQVHRLDPSSGSIVPLTRLAGGAFAPRWSPDGASLAVLSPIGGSDRPDAAAPIVVDRPDYRGDDVGVRDGSRLHLFVVDAESGDARRLTSGEWDASPAAWSPSGRTIAFVADPHPSAAFPLTTNGYTLPASGGVPEAVAADALASVSSVGWTPGGDLLVVGRRGAGIDQDQPFLVASRDGDVLPLARHLDLCAQLGGGEWYGVAPAFLGDREFMLGFGDDGANSVVVLDLDGEVVRRLPTAATEVVAGASATADGSVIAAVIVDSQSYGEVVVFSGGKRTQLTRHTRGALTDVRFVEPRRIGATSIDGRSLKGWILGAEDAPEPAPLFVDIHGGPHLAWAGCLQQANPYHQVLASTGWLVLLPDPRGSDGYGQAFFRAEVGDWGGADAADVLAFVDDLVSAGVADPNRIVIAGYSYGGYLTARITASDRRFAACVVAGGITDLQSLIGTHDLAPDLNAAEFGFDPFADPARLDRMSPIRDVRLVSTPTLLLHAERDFRCPIGQAAQWFRALTHRGVETRFVRYPDASHQFIVDGRLSHRIDYSTRIVEWARSHTTSGGSIPEHEKDSA